MNATARERLLRLLADNPDPAFTQSDAHLRGWVKGLTEGIAVAAEAPAPDLRTRITDAIGPTMRIGLQDAELDGHGGAERIGDWIEWIADALLPLFAAERAAAYADGQAQYPDETVQINGVNYRDTATARAAGAFSNRASQRRQQ